MSAEDRLARLREHALSLEQSIENIDHEINPTVGHEGAPATSPQGAPPGVAPVARGTGFQTIVSRKSAADG
ncbi:MAG: hypothetical protein E5V91_19885 [Mesorhizobium sp.]|nr:MAG: hypothetical protein E5V91_19885 [Mesorhizobium sp.]